MGYVAKLIFNKRYLMIDGSGSGVNGRLALGNDFVPPTTVETPLVSMGTSANRYRGGSRVGQRAGNATFAFSVFATGSSGAECDRAIADLEDFLRLAGRGKAKHPLFLEWKPDNNTTFEPLWGQFGANRRLEIVHARVVRSALYGLADLREKRQVARVELQIKPYATGREQRLAAAAGAVLEDTIGTTGGYSRGTIFASGMATAALGNEITNPVFGHATWNNGWTADGSLIVEQNTDPEFLLPATSSSAKITSRSTNQEFYMAINTGETNTHAFSCYAKKADGTSVTSADLVLYYNAALTTTYTSAGDGWWRLTATAAGINAATNTGIQVKDGRTVYVSGFQMEESSLVTPLCHGDLLGSAWASTPHASASTRTAGQMKLAYAADTFNLGQGTVRVVWRPAYDSNVSGDRWFFADDAPRFSAHYESAGDIYEFSDGTNTAQSATQTFSAGDIIVLHFAYRPGTGLLIYVNGAADGTAATYSPPPAFTSLFIGCDSAGANQSNGTMLDFTIFGRHMTDTEILADYNNIRQVTSDEQPLSPIPYLWTKDGDAIVGNCDDSSRDNWCCCNGIPGSIPALTKFDLTRSYNSAKELLLANVIYDYYLPPSRTFFHDLSGVVNGNSCGGEYEQQITVSTAATFVGSGLLDYEYAVLAGQEVVAVTRLAYTATTDLFQVGLRYGSVATSVIDSDGQYITGQGTGTFRLYRSDALILPDLDYLFLDDASFDGTNQWHRATVGRAGNTHNCDYFAILPTEQLLILTPSVATGGGGTQSFIMEGERAMSYVSGVPEAIAYFDGRPVELVPGMANIIMSFLGDSSEDPTITRTLTYNSVKITPRWALA